MDESRANRSPLVFWAVAPFLVLGALAVSVPLGQETTQQFVAVVVYDLFTLLALLVLWPYHRVPGVGRGLAALSGLLMLAVAADGWSGSGNLLSSLVPAGLALTLLWCAASGRLPSLEQIARLRAGDPHALPPTRPRVYMLNFATSKFDLDAEPTNPINPIPGQSFLAWLGPQLEARGHVVEGPDAEDWGWYMTVELGGRRYLVGSSAIRDGAAADFMVQVRRWRTLTELLRGERPIQRDDDLLALVEEAVGGPEFEHVDFTAG